MHNPRRARALAVCTDAAFSRQSRLPARSVLVPTGDQDPQSAI